MRSGGALSLASGRDARFFAGCLSLIASTKPYLRPRVPERPEGRIINLDPKADWPL
jgi:hypothetical protein